MFPFNESYSKKIVKSKKIGSKFDRQFFSPFLIQVWQLPPLSTGKYRENIFPPHTCQSPLRFPILPLRYINIFSFSICLRFFLFIVRPLNLRSAKISFFPHISLYLPHRIAVRAGDFDPAESIQGLNISLYRFRRQN